MKIKYNKKELNKILKSINWKETTPPKRKVINALKVKKVKVVILGQDPYPTRGVANGYAFAVNKNIKIPQSLNQILKEVKETQGFVKTDRTLKHWKKQGILLLNTSLTTKINSSNSHQNIWKKFIEKIIIELGKDKEIIWILWGNEAKKYEKIINSNFIITDVHPSPLSAYKRKGDSFKRLKELMSIDL